MGLSTHIKAFTPDNDPEYKKHKKVLLACIEANISLPKETAKYFNCEYKQEVDEGDKYLLEERLEIELKLGDHYKKWQGIDSHGFEININDIPKGVTKLRFYNSW